VLRLARVLLLAAVTFCLVAPSASAASTSLGGILGNLWTTVLETPTPENPFNGTGAPAYACFGLSGGIVAPFGPNGAASCAVQPGTKIFVTAQSTECSTFPNDCGGPGSNEAQLRAAAEAGDAGVTSVTVTVDGQAVPVTVVETGLLSIDLPKDNIFGVSGADRSGLSVAHGWVALLSSLTHGTHTIHIVVEGTPSSDITTTIMVQ
jgi:hypothetical protein